GQTMPADDAPQVPLTFSLETVNSSQNQALTQRVRKAIPKTPESRDAPLSGDSKDFLARHSLPARLASEQSGVPHQLIMAHAALESG
ncbi:flagellar assembly peptidoglycan hydrolase FlgJ, partial [Salmonella enterica subsp. enterica serovar Infantis]